MSLRLALIAAVLVLAPAAVPASARAQAHGEAHGEHVVALLPLAAEARFQLYGQPVASEVARALREGAIDVVVVSAGAAVPARARLVIDGRIAGLPGGAVVIEARVRDPARGTVVTTLSARAAALTSIDRAASELAARLLPAVREQLAVLERPPAAPIAVAPIAPRTQPRPSPSSTALPIAHVVLVHRAPFPATRSLAEQVAARLGYRAELADAEVPGALTLRFDVLGFSLDDVGVPIGRVRVHVRVTTARGAVFDRIVHTDTLVGGRRSTPDDLARAGAAQLVEILVPRIRERLGAPR